MPIRVTYELNTVLGNHCGSAGTQTVRKSWNVHRVQVPAHVRILWNERFPSIDYVHLLRYKM